MRDYRGVLTPPKLSDLGAVADAYENYVIRFGRAEAISAISVIWNGGGLYTGYDIAAETLITLVSDDTDDEAGQGGATMIRIVGQGGDGIIKREDVLITGMVPADSTEKFAYIEDIIVWGTEDAGQFTGPNHGDIIAYEKGSALNIAAKIMATKGSSLMCIYRVPANKYAELKHVDVFPVATQPVVSGVHIRLPGGIWNTAAEADFAQTTLNFILQGQLFLPPGTDINLVATPKTTADIGALMELKLYDIDLT